MISVVVGSGSFTGGGEAAVALSVLQSAGGRCKDFNGVAVVVDPSICRNRNSWRTKEMCLWLRRHQS